jgi:phosphatidylserine/phosphatidylglycerophosphate/cardiolipin synthase-like enzyme
VDRGRLALAFSESTASSVEVLVGGKAFFPRMLEDVASASSSVHINQFGFRPGVVGDAFADALIRRAADGVTVRLVVDRRGSDSERGAKALYDRLAAAGVQICLVRALQPRAPAGPFGSAGATRWNLAALGHVDHRKNMVVDGRPFRRLSFTTPPAGTDRSPMRSRTCSRARARRLTSSTPTSRTAG